MLARERALQKQRRLERGAVAAEAADDLHAERQVRSRASPGTLTHGAPISVHSRLNTGSPVEPRPCGAAPGADGVRITSCSAMVSASTWRARLAVRRAASYSSAVIAAARSSCSRNGVADQVAVMIVFEGERAKHFVVLNGELRARRPLPGSAAASPRSTFAPAASRDRARRLRARRCIAALACGHRCVRTSAMRGAAGAPRSTRKSRSMIAAAAKATSATPAPNKPAVSRCQETHFTPTAGSAGTTA